MVARRAHNPEVEGSSPSPATMNLKPSMWAAFIRLKKSDIEKGDINMSRKKKGSVPVAPPKQEKKMVIDMNTMNLKKEHAVPGFRTGGHMTTKDRPRKKDWKREYERGKEPDRYRDDSRSGSFNVLSIFLDEWDNVNYNRSADGALVKRRRCHEQNQ